MDHEIEAKTTAAQPDERVATTRVLVAHLRQTRATALSLDLLDRVDYLLDRLANAPLCPRCQQGYILAAQPDDGKLLDLIAIVSQVVYDAAPCPVCDGELNAHRQSDCAIQAYQERIIAALEAAANQERTVEK